MICPLCHGKSVVYDSRQWGEKRRRMYCCTVCGTRYGTVEVYDKSTIARREGLPEWRRKKRS